jgi:signal transduction histidine kinase
MSIKKICLHIILAFSCLFAKGQAGSGFIAANKQLSDSLIKVLNNHPKADTARINILGSIYGKAVFVKEKKEALVYWNEAYTLAKKLNYTDGLLKCMWWQGTFKKSEGNYTEAHLIFDSVIAYKVPFETAASNWAKAASMYEKSTIFITANDYTSALKYLLQCTPYYEANLQERTLHVYGNFKKIFTQLGNLEKMEEYSRKIITISKKMGVPLSRYAIHYSDIAELRLLQKKYEEVKLYLDSAKYAIPRPGETMVNASYYLRKAILLWHYKQTDSADANYKTAIGYAKELGHNNFTANLYGWYAEFLLECGKTAQAKEYADKMLTIAGSKTLLAEALKLKAQTAFLQGNSHSAYQSLFAANLYYDSAGLEEQRKQINYLNAKYDASRRENDITQLTLKANEQQQRLDRKSNFNWLLGISLLSLVFVGFMMYMNLRNRQKIHKQRITELENEKKLAAADALMQGQEEERKRIATDLHDGLGGMLSGVKLTFNNMKENLVLTPDKVERFEKCLEQLDNSIGELRKISHNLMPDVLVKFGLDEALRDYCASMSGTPHPVVIFQYQGTERSFNNTSKLFIYRIIQELIYNAVKHAAATEILAQLTVSPLQVLIDVDDNGKGFATSELIGSKGMGMKNVKQRVEYLNGTLQIDSKSGKGTSVNIELYI